MVEPEHTPEHTPEQGKSYKDAAAATTTGVTARAGPAAGRGRTARRLGFGRWGQLSAAQLYTLLGLAHAFIAVPLVFSCQAVARATFGKAADPPEEQHCHLFQLYASGLLSSMAVCFALEELSRRRLLHTFTADTLKLGLIGHSLAWLVLVLNYPATLTPLALALEGLACAATAALPASHLLASPQDRGRVWHDLQRLPRAAPAFLAFRSRARFSWMDIFYSLLAVTMPVVGASYFLAPRFTLTHTFGYDYGRSTQLIWKAIGAGALMTFIPAQLVALKHKADTDNLSTGPGRALNLGLMGTAVGHLLVLGPILAQGNGGFLLPGVVSAWFLALITSMLGLSAPELAQLAEEVTSEARRVE